MVKLSGVGFLITALSFYFSWCYFCSIFSFLFFSSGPWVECWLLGGMRKRKSTSQSYCRASADEFERIEVKSNEHKKNKLGGIRMAKSLFLATRVTCACVWKQCALKKHEKRHRVGRNRSSALGLSVQTDGCGSKFIRSKYCAFGVNISYFIFVRELQSATASALKGPRRDLLWGTTSASCRRRIREEVRRGGQQQKCCTLSQG